MSYFQNCLTYYTKIVWIFLNKSGELWKEASAMTMAEFYFQSSKF